MMEYNEFVERFLNSTSKDVKETVLHYVDAKHALLFSLKNRTLRNILKTDKIWHEWFRRDLSIIPHVIPQWFPTMGETPIWKRYYLWCRLCVGLMQWSRIKIWNEPNIQYEGLNRLTNGTSFENEFIDQTALDYTFDNIFDSRFFPDRISFTKIIMSKYKGANINTPNIDEIGYAVWNLAHAIQKLGLDGIPRWPDGFSIRIFGTSPRIIDKLLIGCSVCESAESQHRCSSCDKPYCSVECAQRDWDNYNCIKQ
jgi:hypothetical protein